MKEKTLNGTLIPYELSIEKLKEMMSSSNMKNFSLACESLSYKSAPEAYQIMKSYITDKDKYHRLYVLKTIFRHPEACELIDFLESSIASNDLLFIENGLIIVSEYNIKVSESLIISTVKKHCDKLHFALNALNSLETNNDNYLKLIEIFTSCKKCIQKEILGEILCNKYLPQKSQELFEVFKNDTFSKIRPIALKIGKKYGFDTSIFLSDSDGHVKKAAK